MRNPHFGNLRFDLHYAVELGSELKASLRFGDTEVGLRVLDGAGHQVETRSAGESVTFSATNHELYRVRIDHG